MNKYEYLNDIEIKVLEAYRICSSAVFYTSDKDNQERISKFDKAILFNMEAKNNE